MSSEYFYDCLNTHNCGYSFTSSKKERRCARCDSSFIDLRSVESKCEDNSKQRIFDSIEHLKHEYNLDVEIPKDIPEGCNVISWESSDKNAIVFYKEDEELHYWSLSIKDWCSVGNISLEQEVYDDVQNGYGCIYLRLTTKDNSDVFTPERLLGVETNCGRITSVVIDEQFTECFKPTLFVYTTKSSSKEDLLDVHKLKYYISDNSDETVSFEEYVKMFYNGDAYEG